MKTKVRRDYFATFAAGSATLFLMVACQVGSRASWPPVDSTDVPPVATPSATASATTLATHPATASATPSADATDGCAAADLFIEYAPYSVASLASLDQDFVVAEVVGFVPAIFNTEDGQPRPFGMNPSSPDPNSHGRTMIYTPVDVLIVSSIRGSWAPGPSRFLIAGGTVGCYQMTVDVAPKVHVGSRYVFILADAIDAEGDNVLPLLETKFAWPVDSAGMVTTVDGLMSLDELTEIVLEATASPVPQETMNSN